MLLDNIINVPTSPMSASHHTRALERFDEFARKVSTIDCNFFLNLCTKSHPKPRIPSNTQPPPFTVKRAWKIVKLVQSSLQRVDDTKGK